MAYGSALGRLPLGCMPWVAGRRLPPLGDRIFRRYLGVFGYPSVVAHLLHPVALRLLDVQPGDLILDAGCGKALLTTDARVASCRGYWAIDAVPLRALHARYLASHLAERACSAAMDLTDLAFRDAAFDKVACLEVIEHVEDDERALRELYRVLRPGGRLVLSTEASAEVTPLAVHTRHRDHVRSGYTREGLEGKLRAAGFRPERWIAFRGPRADKVFAVENAFVSRGLAWALPAVFPVLWAIARFDNPSEHKDGHHGQLVAAVRPEDR